MTTPKPVARPEPPRERLTPARRYRDDPRFHALVSVMESYIHMGQFTPTEVREAALLATVHYEMRQFPSFTHLLSGVAVVEPGIRPGQPPELLVIDGLPYRLSTGEGPLGSQKP